MSFPPSLILATDRRQFARSSTHFSFHLRVRACFLCPARTLPPRHLDAACLAWVFVMLQPHSLSPECPLILLISFSLNGIVCFNATDFHPLHRSLAILKEKAAASRLGVAGADKNGPSPFTSPRKAPRAPPSPARAVAPVVVPVSLTPANGDADLFYVALTFLRSLLNLVYLLSCHYIGPMLSNDQSYLPTS